MHFRVGVINRHKPQHGTHANFLNRLRLHHHSPDEWVLVFEHIGNPRKLCNISFTHQSDLKKFPITPLLHYLHPERSEGRNLQRETHPQLPAMGSRCTFGSCLP